jgi:parvulin-like peptidyl-prolyl isomerase
MDKLKAAPPGRYPAEVELRVGDVIAERLLVAEAAARGLGDDPAVADPLRADEELALVEIYLHRFVTQEVSATDEEVARGYEARKAEFVRPEERFLAQIVVDGPEAMAEVRKRIDAGEGFDAVASEVSKNEEQRRRGGLVGWVPKKDLPEGFGPVFAARKGEVLGPIAAKDGLHLVKVMDIRPEAPIERAEAEKTIREELLASRRGERYRRFLAELRSQAEIEVSDAGIRQYLRDHPVPEPRPAPVMGGAATPGPGHGSGGHPAPAQPAPTQR